MDIKVWVATRAFIVNEEGKILIIRESSKYEDGNNVAKYDVVGGRIDAGQRFDESLLREVKEETGLDVTIGKPFFVNEWRPVIKGEQWQIVGIFFVCKALSTNVVLSEDHDAYEWIDPALYTSYDIIPTIAEAFKAYPSGTN